MGMQDNPLVGDYTKGISKNTHQYFENLGARVSREKADVSRLKTDFENPLFAMIRGPVDPLKLDRKGRVPVDNYVEKAPPKPSVVTKERPPVTKKRGWTTVKLADLQQVIGTIQSSSQGQKRNKRP